jgi:hypothetical protein
VSSVTGFPPFTALTGRVPSLFLLNPNDKISEPTQARVLIPVAEFIKEASRIQVCIKIPVVHLCLSSISPFVGKNKKLMQRK